MTTSVRRQLLIAGAVVALGVVVFFGLLKSAPKAKERVTERLATLVRVSEAKRAQSRAALVAQGTVTAAKRVAVSAQVGGKVVWRSANLVLGGRVKRGETLLRIEGADYEAQVAQRRAELNRARLELQLERGRQQVAEKEWSLFGDGGVDDANRALAERKPQLESAEVGVEAASSALDKATMDLARTGIRAPFDGIVVSEGAEKGQVVAPQQVLATLVSTDEVWVLVSVPVASLSQLTFAQGDGEGTSATVTREGTSGAGTRDTWPGEALRVLAELDSAGRMARVVVRVPRPFDGEHGTPLLIGSYVSVTFEARSPEGWMEIPMVALRDNGEVHVMREGTLHVQKVEVAWKTRDVVYLRSGLNEGDRVITSTIATPVAGMALRTEAKAPREPEK